MTRKILILFVLAIFSLYAEAQSTDRTELYVTNQTAEPFLYSVSALTPHDLAWTFNYSSSYGERVSGPFGYDGVSQQLAVKGYLGSQFTLYAFATVGFPGQNAVASAQQAEIIRNLIGGKKSEGLRVGMGLGFSRDFDDVKSLLSRATVSFDTKRWKAGGNLLFEKAFASNRDAIDIITSLGFHYCLTGNLFAGFEAIGEDLEGFWDPEEAEGGAKLMIGPSVNMAPKKSRFTFSLSGGPVFYATQNEASNPAAMRELPSQAGLTIRARVIFNLSGS